MREMQYALLQAVFALRGGIGGWMREMQYALLQAVFALRGGIGGGLYIRTAE